MKLNPNMLRTFGMGALLLLATSCEKDNNEPNRNNPSTPQQPKHNVELTYGNKPSTNWQHIEMDTIAKYNSDPNVDTIFMIPEYYNQFNSLPTTSLKNLIIKLRERHNVNPNKIFGKGELQLNSASTINNPEIVKFFQDTLGYYVTYYNQAKSK